MAIRKMKMIGNIFIQLLQVVNGRKYLHRVILLGLNFPFQGKRAKWLSSADTGRVGVWRHTRTHLSAYSFLRRMCQKLQQKLPLPLLHTHAPFSGFSHLLLWPGHPRTVVSVSVQPPTIIPGQWCRSLPIFHTRKGGEKRPQFNTTSHSWAAGAQVLERSDPPASTELPPHGCFRSTWPGNHLGCEVLICKHGHQRSHLVTPWRGWDDFKQGKRV